jgi:hypothetical protein
MGTGSGLPQKTKQLESIWDDFIGTDARTKRRYFLEKAGAA